ncbi:MAG: hypothetical protein QMC37_09925, partial [Flavobacteriales bacterium]|tara:strand:- start:378 stop:572 length:195 start_codon:yes stop_codon:yes gene_type:complete
MSPVFITVSSFDSFVAPESMSDTGVKWSHSFILLVRLVLDEVESAFKLSELALEAMILSFEKSL